MKKSIAFLVLLFLISEIIHGQKKEMSIVDFLNIPGVSDPQLSPNGSEILYVLSNSDWEVNKQVGHIWQVSVDGKETRQMTYGQGESNPRWSPDGKWIIFITKRNEEEENQIYIMRTDGGEATNLTNHQTAVSAHQWAPDSETIYFLANDTLSTEKEAARELDDDVYALDENYEQRHLWKVSVADGIETQLTSGDYSIINYNVSRDGQKIVAHRGPNPLFDYRKESEVWVMDADGSDAKQLTTNTIGESGAKLSPDGSKVLFVAFANDSYEFYYNDKLFILPTDGNGAVSVPMKEKTFEVQSAEWSVDGNSIYFTANMGSQSQLWNYNLITNTSSQLTQGNHSIGNWRYHPSLDQNVFTKNNMSNPGDIHLLRNGSLVQVTHRYDYLSKEFFLPRQEVISWKGEDGVDVEGMIYYPHDYQPGTKYPLVVQTHGGPASSDKFGMSRSFTRYNPVLTAKGYVVLQPNYRGSTGYGDAFLRDMVGGYFRQSHLDVMAGVDLLLAQGVADPDRMVKMGWSAGGHMTNKIITFTNRFKAASSGAGAVNWMGMYAQSDVRTYRTPWFGGSPWQKNAPIDVYWDNSPLKDISNVTTPTLVIVGESDPRVPLPQSVELYRALRSLGVPTHLYVAPREPHGWRELRHRLYKINVELDWFSKYALGQEYQWEKIE